MADHEHFAEEERKVVQEFCYLLEKSKQLFNGLRDLPQYGHKQWQSYFGRTFDVYTKLWKFQQQNRQILDTKYGLKRWQIGEIASKIGQLYYHYYLRTSETNYLNESFSFYSAIRARAYYSKANKEGPELCVKKLRYYARFVVVCLLLRKISLVRELIQELNKQIEEYTSLYEPEDQLEWQLVLGEIRSFIDAEQIINVIETDTKPLVLTHRLSKDGVPALDRGQHVYLTLQEALIIGNCNEQIKFSELTLDMYRILQALEREPKGDDIHHHHHHNDSSPAPGQQPVENGDRTGKRENPHKYLLYKPTFGQLFTFLSAGFKELPPNAALLIYLSADGSSGSERPEDEGAYDYGGVVTNNRREPGEPLQMKRSHLLKEMHCLHPGDLYPFSRKPLFLVVDSTNSVVFKNVPNLFGQPLVCLMSPTQLPKNLQDQNTKGNLFTLFMYSPLTAFCHVCDIGDIPVALWEKCQKHVTMVTQETATLISKSRSLDHTYMQFYGDEFLRLLMLRFVFCYVTLKYHRGFKDDTYYPQSHPEMKGCDILENVNLHKWILELASILDVRALFLEVSELE